MIGLKHGVLNYKAKLCAVDDSNGSFDMDLTDYQNMDSDPDQDVYISGINIEKNGATAKFEKIIFDRSLLLKMKRALKRFRNCLKKNRQGQDCNIEGLLHKADSEKVINVEFDQLLNGALKISKMTIEPLFGRRKRRDAAARPTVLVPKACRNPHSLKICHGSTPITVKPSLAFKVRKNTFVKVTIHKQFGDLMAFHVPRRRMRRTIIVHYHSEIKENSNNINSKSTMSTSVPDDDKSSNTSQTVHVLYESLKALLHF